MHYSIYNSNYDITDVVFILSFLSDNIYNYETIDRHEIVLIIDIGPTSISLFCFLV